MQSDCEPAAAPTVRAPLNPTARSIRSVAGSKQAARVVARPLIHTRTDPPLLSPWSIFRAAAAPMHEPRSGCHAGASGEATQRRPAQQNSWCVLLAMQTYAWAIGSTGLHRSAQADMPWAIGHRRCRPRSIWRSMGAATCTCRREGRACPWTVGRRPGAMMRGVPHGRGCERACRADTAVAVRGATS